jgi:pyocin large subunit-like protein
VEVLPTNAVVRWVTDVPAETKVRVDSPSAKVTVTQGNSPATNHEAVISGLQAGMRYTVVVGTARVWLATNTFTTSGLVEARNPADKLASPLPAKKVASSAPPSRKTWGNPTSLADHFERHGGDFQARDPEDYARQAWEFLQRAKAEGLPAKVDEDKVLRVFDPKTRTFAAYNRDETTRTFFKPESRTYFDRQPGKPVNLKTWR